MKSVSVLARGSACPRRKASFKAGVLCHAGVTALITFILLPKQVHVLQEHLDTTFFMPLDETMKSLGERKIWAQDDYKKFIRFAQLRILDTGSGIVGFITNHGFINEPTSRGMRHSLIGSFPRISVLDLHGSLKKRETCPDGSPDKNVFDIEPGVAISLLRRGAESTNLVTHADLWGLREAKYTYLLEHAAGSTPTTIVTPSPEFYLLVPQSGHTKEEFSKYVNVTDIFVSGSNGIQTSRDHIVYGFRRTECRKIIEEFRSPETVISTKELREKFWPGKKVADYAPGDTRGWRVPEARKRLRNDSDWEGRFTRALYRPLDWQTLFYADYMIDWPRLEVMSQMLKPNLSLCVGRAGSAADNQEWNIVFVANTLVDMNLFYRGGNVNYPLRVGGMAGRLGFDEKWHLNFKTAFLKSVSSALDLPQMGELSLPKSLTPEDIFHYAYAVFYSPGYRNRYAEFLKIDFPRLPLTSILDLFRALAKLGGELVALHLMESPKVNNHITKWVGGRNLEVEKVTYSEDTVWIDRAKTEGFRRVPENVWNFHIGGYQVCEKWLKDRKGRKLSADDIAHYQKIVVALNETIRLMGEIDEVIEKHGGWPGAFVKNQNVQVQKTETVSQLLPQEEFIISLIKKLRGGENKGIHSVFSGFNGLFKEKFPGDKPQAWTKKLAEEGRVVTTPIKGKGKEYQMIYLSEDAAKN